MNKNKGWRVCANLPIFSGWYSVIKNGKKVFLEKTAGSSKGPQGLSARVTHGDENFFNNGTTVNYFHNRNAKVTLTRWEQRFLVFSVTCTQYLKCKIHPNSSFNLSFILFHEFKTV